MPRTFRITPLNLTLAYAALGTAWIIGSDSLALWWTPDSAILTEISSLKGLLFIAVTSFALYGWARRLHRRMLAETAALAQARIGVEQSRRRYATLSAVNRLIIRPSDRVQLCQAICDALIQPGGLAAAWVGRTSGDGALVTAVAGAGVAPAREFPLNPQAEDGRILAAALREHTAASCPAPHPEGGAISELNATVGAHSWVAMPFQPRGDAPLLLVVHCRDHEFASPEAASLLAELAADLEFGLDAITEREARATAESALRASELRYRLVAENSQDVIWIMSPEGKLQYVSPSVQRLLGISAEKAVTMNLADIVTPSSYEMIARELELARTDPNPSAQRYVRLLEVEQQRSDGSTVWTEVNTSGLTDDTGRTIGILGVTRDITQRRLAEQALASEVTRVRALLDVSVDAIQITDLEGRLLDANEIFLRERGFTRDMIPKLRIEDWNAELAPGEIRTRLATIGSEPARFETVHRRSDSSVFTVEVHSKRVEANGRVMIYTTTRDVTKHRELEQRALRAQRLESVGLIASGIAHDLNNVLTPILLSTGLLEMRYTAPEDEALLKPIEAAARRGSNIVQQILTFARGAEGKRIAVEPRLLLKELTTLIRETFPRNIVHKLDLPAEVWPVRGDPTQLHQVLLNLAVNARDAMPAGGTLTLRVSSRHLSEATSKAIPSANAGDYVCICVSDTGTGMTPDVLDHLFEPFFTTKPRGRGTGLGLSTVHGLVRSHGGFVEVHSKLGQGSEFCVFLPAAREPLPSSPVAVPTPFHAGRGESILIADDEPAILSVMAPVLQRNGYVAIAALDGAEALALLEQHQDKIAAVVTDVMMPTFDGIQLVTEIRRRRPELPVIAMSGMISTSIEDDSREQLRALGVTRVLDKPYTETALLKAIADALSGDASALETSG